MHAPVAAEAEREAPVHPLISIYIHIILQPVLKIKICGTSSPLIAVE